MVWTVCFFTAAALLAVSVLLGIAQSRRKRRRGLKPFQLLFLGVILAAIFIFIPIYTSLYEDGGLLETVFLSIHTMIRLFVVDGELSFIADHLAGIPDWLSAPYSYLAASLYLLAPIITFSFVLSFFRNLTANLRFLRHFKTPLYVFSELNEKSLALADSIARTTDRHLLIFMDVFEQNEEESYEQVAEATALGALLYKKDIVTINLFAHSRKSPITLFAIGADEAENAGQALRLIKKYQERKGTELYIFSAQPEAELLFSGIAYGEIHVRRVNEFQSLVYYYLYRKGLSLFENAVEVDGHKEINAVIVGLRQHGLEMAKALPWFCQMDGYRVNLHVFDEEPDAASRFAMLCPELMDEAHNGNFTDDGEAQYRITITGGVDLESAAFFEALKDLPRTTYALVSLCDDERNIRTAIQLRLHFERMKQRPAIHAIIYNPDKKEALDGISNFSGQKYDIDFSGDIRTIYSSEVILTSELEHAALERHLKWGRESDFWRFEYNHRSSVASAIHGRMKRACGIPGADLPPGQRREEDRVALRKLEHRRWNAYMRSEGYIYSGSTEKSSRNDLGKLHNCLVPFDQLSKAEQEKDDD